MIYKKAKGAPCFFIKEKILYKAVSVSYCFFSRPRPMQGTHTEPLGIWAIFADSSKGDDKPRIDCTVSKTTVKTVRNI